MKNTKSLPLLAAISAIAFAFASPVFAQDPMPEPKPGSTPSADHPSSDYPSSTPSVEYPATPAAPTVDTKVDYDASSDVKALKSANFGTRSNTLSSIETNVATAASTLANIESQLNNVANPDSEVKDALDEAITANTEVRSSLNELYSADENSFADAREEAVDALQRFAEATSALNEALGATS